MAEGALRPVLERYVTGYRLDRRDFQCLAFVQRWQQAGQATGEQGLAGAWRTAEQQIVEGYTKFIF